MKQPHWLTTADVLKLHRMQIDEFGGATHLRDYGLLESAVVRPQQRYHYGELSTIPELAAAYAIALSANHPFADGNKRVAFHALLVFLRINGFRLDAPVNEAAEKMLAVASGETDEATLVEWVKTNISH